MEREPLDIGRIPAEPGAGQAEGRGRGDEAKLGQREVAQQLVADAVAERIAGREHDDTLAAPALDLGKRVREGRAPGNANGCRRQGRDKTQMACATH